MNIEFFKYQGAGNDFVMIDNRSNRPQLSKSQIVLICDRKFGVGADGLVFLCNSANSDFEMIYYNSDGSIGSMCGNGGRCIVAFANSGIILFAVFPTSIVGICIAVGKKNLFP